MLERLGRSEKNELLHIQNSKRNVRSVEWSVPSNDTLGKMVKIL